ncbi:MAG: M14 family zinc carboxypeptidase [bacterium]
MKKIEPDIESLSNYLYENFEVYSEKSFNNPTVKYQDILPLINKTKKMAGFNVQKLGTSLEGRDIFSIKFGTGTTKVLAWSQMHGDEPTATRALFNIINFLSRKDEEQPVKDFLIDKLEVVFIPMLNPDGAEKYSRRNSVKIDLNRDALKLQSPEAVILYNYWKKFQPHFCLNLHDQNSSYTAGYNHHSAAISFLSPPFNYKKEINIVRENSMKIIARAAKILSGFIPGHIARYNDEFEPRAFGDNFTKDGSSTILIESGSWKDDPQKLFLEKITFIAILSVLHSIASKNYLQENIESYFAIPENKELMYDLVFRNLTYKKELGSFLVDVAIKRTGKLDPVSNQIFCESSLEDFGDLSTHYGHEEIDCTGMEISSGKIYNEKIFTTDEIRDLDYDKLYASGYTGIKVERVNFGCNNSRIPMNIIICTNILSTEIELEKPANFIIKKNGDVKFVVINGFVADMQSKINNIQNGLIL